jgi:hypothetical protein
MDEYVKTALKRPAVQIELGPACNLFNEKTARLAFNHMLQSR